MAWSVIPEKEWQAREAVPGRKYRMTYTLNRLFGEGTARTLASLVLLKCRADARIRNVAVDVMPPLAVAHRQGAIDPWRIRVTFEKATTNTPLIFFVGIIGVVVVAVVGFVVVSKQLEELVQESGDTLLSPGMVIVGLVIAGLALTRRGG